MGPELVVKCTHAGGLHWAHGNKGKGLEVAGADRTWTATTARLQGRSILLNSALVAQPIAPPGVLFPGGAWRMTPACRPPFRASI